MIMTFSGVLHQLQDFERLIYCHLASSIVEKSKTILNPLYVIHFLSGNLIFFASALKFYSMCLGMGLFYSTVLVTWWVLSIWKLRLFNSGKFS